MNTPHNGELALLVNWQWGSSKSREDDQVVESWAQHRDGTLYPDLPG